MMDLKLDAFSDSAAALGAFKPNYYDALIFDIRMIHIYPWYLLMNTFIVLAS
jgi:hypothetical protein